MSMQDEFIETSTAMRVKIAASFVALVSVLESARRWLLPRLIEHARTLPPCEQYELLFGAVMALIILGTVVVSITMGSFAFRLLKHQQLPLPGAWVWHRTRVRRGRMVRVGAYLIMASCVALCGFMAWSSRFLTEAYAEGSCNRPAAQSSTDSRLRPCSGLSPCHALYARAKLLAAL